MTLRSAFLNLTEKKIDWELVLCEMNKTSLCNYLIRLSIVILRTFIGENQVNFNKRLNIIHVFVAIKEKNVLDIYRN